MHALAKLQLSDDTGSAEQKPADSAAAEEGVFDPLVGALDRAKAVEDIGFERKQELDERMEALE